MEEYILCYQINGSTNMMEILHNTKTLEEMDSYTSGFVNSNHVKKTFINKIIDFNNLLRYRRKLDDKKKNVESIRLYKVYKTYEEKIEKCKEEDFSLCYGRIYSLGHEDIEYWDQDGEIYFRYKEEHCYYENIAVIYRGESKLYSLDICEKKVLEKLKKRDIKVIAALIEEKCTILGNKSSLKDSLKRSLYYYTRDENNNVIYKINDKLYNMFLIKITNYIKNLKGNNKYVFYRKCINVFELRDPYKKNMPKKDEKIDAIHAKKEYSLESQEENNLLLVKGRRK